MAEQVKWRTVGIGVGAAVVIALGGGWAANAAGVFDRPAPTPTSVVQDENSTPTPTVTPTPTPSPTAEPEVVEQAPAPEETPDAWINDDGTVEGVGCPLPYVDLGYGCQDPICGVDADGNDIPCGG